MDVLKATSKLDALQYMEIHGRKMTALGLQSLLNLASSQLKSLSLHNVAFTAQSIEVKQGLMRFPLLFLSNFHFLPFCVTLAATQ